TETLWKEISAWKFNENFLKQLIPMMQNRMETLGDLIEPCLFFFQREVSYNSQDLVPKDRSIEDIPGIIQTVMWALDELTIWSANEIEKAVHRVIQFWDWKIREVTGVLFVAIMGQHIGPPLYQSMHILGIDLCRRRLMNALDASGGLGKKKLTKLEKSWQNPQT
ncbi:hypothetical protein JW979_06645, partial [bacterium]|nr:hypothetical protein [candidate division CSSED10-310 bacterium]